MERRFNNLNQKQKFFEVRNCSSICSKTKVPDMNKTNTSYSWRHCLWTSKHIYTRLMTRFIMEYLGALQHLRWLDGWRPDFALMGEDWEDKRGKWTTCSTEINDQKLQACKFRDMIVKDSISTCSISIPEKPWKTRHHVLVPCTQVTIAI